MKAVEIPVTLTLPQPKQERSEGVHVSNIIRCIATETGVLSPEWASELSLVDVRTITDPAAVLRIRIGLAWEEHFLPTITGVVDHPGEIEVDGIYMSPDGESLDVLITRPYAGVQLILHECKATYKSTSTVGDLSTQWMWLAQLKAYCRGMGTCFARLHVLFLCGDYKYPITPQLRVWEIEFEQQEIDSNWSLMTEYRDHRLSIEGSL